MSHKPLASAALALALATAGPPPATAQEAGQEADQKADQNSGGATVAAGMLNCRLADVNSIIIFAQERFACTYSAANGEKAAYRGEISRFGAHLVYKDAQVLQWAVIAPAAFGGARILEGVYVGAGTEASFVVGVGARVLVGGSRNQITLQPVSFAGQTGLGASATLDSLKLTYLPS